MVPDRRGSFSSFCKRTAERKIRRNIVIHQYKNNGYNIVMDISSGSVHVVDDVVYDAVALLEPVIGEVMSPVQIPETARKPGSIWQLLDGIKESGLQNDAFLDLLYEMIGERVAPGKVKLLFFVSWNV